MRLPGSPSAPHTDIASLVSHLLPGYVLSTDTNRSIYAQGHGAALDRNTEQTVREEKVEWVPKSRRGVAGRSPPGGDTGAVSWRRAARFPWALTGGLDSDLQSWRGQVDSSWPLPSHTQCPLRPNLSKRTVSQAASQSKQPEFLPSPSTPVCVFEELLWTPR